MNKTKIKQAYSILIFNYENTSKNDINYLKSYYHNVYEAKSEESAFRIYSNKKPHILIIDICIAEVKHLSFLEKIREKDYNTKFILLINNLNNDFLLKASELKLTKCLQKPFTREVLDKALNTAINEINNFHTIYKKVLLLSEDFFWNFDEKRLFNNKIEVNLTSIEQKILIIIFENKINNQSTPYEDILYGIWDEYTNLRLKSLKTIMTNIRKKLPKGSIVNEYGLGYKVKI